MSSETEIHPIANGFIPPSTRILIVGTFPPKMEYLLKGKDFFFYSSVRNQFWNRMDNIFPHMQGLKKTKQKNSHESLSSNKKRKEDFAIKYKLSFLDVFSKVRRKKDSPNDVDLIGVENIIENRKLINLLNSRKKIKRICCTYKLAYEVLKYSLAKSSIKFKIVHDSSSANKERIEIQIKRNKVQLVLLFPATRSSHKRELKDEQYKKYLFG
jgi:G:T/U-mismatch repair DNA glycosylase